MSNGNNTLTWSGFTDDITSSGTTAARFRLSTDANLDESYSLGNLSDGEVEDYLLDLVVATDYGDAPDSLTGAVSAVTTGDIPDYQTVLGDGGASHQLKQDCPITIGSTVDGDTGDAENVDATADGADEDGVFLLGTNTSLQGEDLTVVLGGTYLLDVIVEQPPLAATEVSSTVTGTVYHDYDSDRNFDGTQVITFDDGSTTTSTEIGLEGVVVTAYRNDGTQVDTTISDNNGEYSLNNPTGEPLRIEFSSLPDGYNNTSDTVVFLDGAGNPTVNFGLLQDNHYVDSNSAPRLFTTCFVFGGFNQSSETALVSVLHTSQGENPANKTTEVTYDKVGTVYGLAYSNQTQDIFLGAFQRRHTDLGLGGNDAIYRADSNGNVTTFVELDTYFNAIDLAGTYSHGDGNTESDRPETVSEWSADKDGFASVTKVGFGDVEISADGEHLWTINLANRELYKIEIGDASPYGLSDDLGGTETRTISSFDIINTITDLELGSRDDVSEVVPDLRPFALSEHNGLIYVGLVDSAESTQLASDLHAYVYSFNPDTETFSKELDFALDYTRQSKAGFVNGTSEWQPWVNNFSDLTFSEEQSGDNQGTPWANETQPILSDLEFDNNGDIILGFRDRTADQIGPDTQDTDGNQYTSTLTGELENYQVSSGGDILRGTWNGSTWAIKPDDIDNDIATEYYPGERLETHEETAQGGLVQIPGYNSIEIVALDPIKLISGGIIGLNNNDGYQTRGIELVTDSGKANGLGDLEYAGEVAPIEIGDRIWLDLDRDGLQDAGEPSIAGATVSLYDNLDTLVGQTITDEWGNYYFNDGNVTLGGATGLESITTYEIRLDNAADFATDGALDNLSLTTADSGSNNSLDSDAEDVSGTPTITVTTGEYGENDYTNDFGFVKDITLVGWIDFDRDGNFEETEAVVLDTANGLNTNGETNTLDFTVPNNMPTGETAARFRVASGLEGDNLDANTPNSFAPDGEVEDYVVNFVETVSKNIIDGNGSPNEIFGNLETI